MTVNSFSSVSLDPMLVLVCLDQASRGLGLIERAAAFAVNVLSAGQEDISRWFANRHGPAGSTMFHGVAPLIFHGGTYKSLEHQPLPQVAC